MASLHDYATSPLFSELDRLVLDLATAMCRTPADVSEDLRRRLLERLTPGQLTEIVATIAWENHRARVNRALGVRAAGFSDGAFCVVPQRVD